MTRFVYVLPAGRLRWEVRVAPDPLRHDLSELVLDFDDAAKKTPDRDVAGNYQYAVRIIEAFLEGSSDPKPQFYRRKAHALIAARAVAIVIGGEVQPHNRWGRIQDPSSFGGDSPRRRG